MPGYATRTLTRPRRPEQGVTQVVDNDGNEPSDLHCLGSLDATLNAEIRDRSALDPWAGNSPICRAKDAPS
jgi:hypothetical protein